MCALVNLGVVKLTIVYLSSNYKAPTNGTAVIDGSEEDYKKLEKLAKNNIVPKYISFRASSHNLDCDATPHIILWSIYITPINWKLFVYSVNYRSGHKGFAQLSASDGKVQIQYFF